MCNLPVYLFFNFSFLRLLSGLYSFQYVAKLWRANLKYLIPGINESVGPCF